MFSLPAFWLSTLHSLHRHSSGSFHGFWPQSEGGESWGMRRNRSQILIYRLYACELGVWCESCLPKIHLLLVRPVLKTTVPLITHRQLFMLNWICSLKSDPAQTVWRFHPYKPQNQKPCILVAQHACIWQLCMGLIDNKTPILNLPRCTMVICQATLACPRYCTTHIPLALLITCHTLLYTC